MNYQHLERYYKGKKVFLTGHTGFKGAWMLSWLHALGAQVKGYSLAPENEYDLYNVINGDDMCESVIADIRDRERLKNEIISFSPDFVFHLAAQPLVRLSYEIPAETFDVNAVGTANVLDAIRFLDKPCAGIFITTDKVYENQEWQYPYRENDRLGGYDPYSASKACAELIISSYRNSFFNINSHSAHQKAIASARAGNVIGGGDWAKDRIIPDIIRALRQDQPVSVRNPLSVRPWQHVLEPLGGYLHLGTKLIDDPTTFSDAWNFGPLSEDNLTVEELVNIALKAWGKGAYDKPGLVGQPHEAGLLKLDISKTVANLGWKPKFTARVAIQNTLEWYLKTEQGEQAADLTTQQIAQFSYG
ncbi:CDP-glucose 4,6-dehydratase [Dyadobacter fermentans]|uniref:CDP-glucose 4,6-dehydratase n=1 Tax=Dyadobacter fermentans (strain ATCC 700827 / DSM 18053 / CIP 107007 / KCTC 52180 / NS114) TaxID=471854 RepID=C6W3V5_DYAFD|nr:CDP-glucose 4,6-dehydratase [Dyadobacter fermentans]ACT95803.1 CDP-glucose 4,6-dehydratase [Dyadobacter fermentans DSM 18053]